MNKTLKTVIITAAASLLFARAYYGITLKPYNNDVVKKVAAINQIINEKGFYDINEEVMADSAASGLALSVNDRYTNYYSKEQFKHYTDNLKNSSYTIGVAVTVDEENRIIVSSVMEDSAAQKAGVRHGDIILEVDSVKYTGEELEKAVSVMRGDGLEDIVGTELNLKILRDAKQQDIKIIREVLSYQSVRAKMIENSVGYMRISAFNSASDEKDGKDTYDEFSEKLNGLKKSGMNKLIIDLRNNPGGSLDVVKNIADLLLPEGIITYTEDKFGNREEYKSDSNELDMPIVVLVNSNSASASEVLTGALKDYNKATIVGTKTFGKGVVQSVIPFADGSGLSVTTSKYFTPNGVCIHDIGIEPDVFIEADENFVLSESAIEDDIQLQKAIEIINR